VGKDLEFLAKSELAAIPIGRLKSGDILSHIKRRVDGRAAPATASNDLTRLKTVLEAAWASWDVPVPMEEL